MNSKDLKKAGRYLRRVASNPFSRQSRAALRRYFVMAGELIAERLRGLDFTMVHQGDGNPHNNNYSKTSNHVLKRIFEDVDSLASPYTHTHTREHGFMDVGCGKGYVLSKASCHPFERIGGVEYDPGLTEICVRNLKRLHLDNIQIFCGDARQFEDWKNYDIYFFCNPFDETILSPVMRQIQEGAAEAGRSARVYYVNPHQEERQKAIREAGFHLVKKMEDRNEPYYDVWVYKS